MAVNVLTEAEGLSAAISPTETGTIMIELAIKLTGIALLALTQVLDWHSTLAFLKSGRGREGNTFIARLQQRFGPSRAMILKGLAHGVLIPPILLLPWWVALGLLPYCLIYARIIASNYRIARGHG